MILKNLSLKNLSVYRIKYVLEKFNFCQFEWKFISQNFQTDIFFTSLQNHSMDGWLRIYVALMARVKFPILEIVSRVLKIYSIVLESCILLPVCPDFAY